jgi:hypothetical protein
MIQYSLKSSLHAIYDFAVYGGATGTINFGINLPAGSGYPQINGFAVTCITPLASAGAATISFGLLSTYNVLNPPAVTGPAGHNYGIVSKPNILMAPINYNAFATTQDTEGYYQPLQGAVSASNPLKLYQNVVSWILTMTIGTAALTAGKLQIVLDSNTQNL